MANTAEGLETVKAGEHVNTEAGFAAALAGRGVEPDKETASDTSVSAGLETVEPAVGRGPDGKFVSTKTSQPDTSQTAEDTSTVVTPVTSDDPEIAAFLAKYNGDVAEALKAATHAQSLIGRRDEEREALAEKVARLEGLVEGIKAGAPQAQAVAMSDEDIEEAAAQSVASKGFEGAATEAANLSIQMNGDERLLRSIYDQWNLEDPWAANNFLADFRAWQRTQAAAPAPQSDAWVEEQKTVAGMNETFASLMQEIGAEAFGAITSVVEGQQSSPLAAALEQQPKAVLDLVTSDKAEERLAGARIVADRAMLLAGTKAAPAEVQEVVEPGMPVSVARKLAGAGVATAGLRPVTQAQGGEPSREEALKGFKQQILEAETTSVASGLTYGPSK
jgi:hypothetical protein